jgi:hypothetical protein
MAHPYAAIMKSVRHIRTTQNGIRMRFFQITTGDCAMMLDDGVIMDLLLSSLLSRRKPLKAEWGMTLNF